MYPTTPRANVPPPASQAKGQVRGQKALLPQTYEAGDAERAGGADVPSDTTLLVASSSPEANDPDDEDYMG